MSSTTPSQNEDAAASEKDPERGAESPVLDQVEKQQGPVVKKLSTLSWVLTCAGFYLSALLYGLDTTIAADVQASVYADLGHIENLPWVGIGFPMASVAIILLVGKLYGTFEIKRLYIGFLVLFEIGSALCGAAPTSDALIIGRVIAGMGGAGIYIGALTYISVFTTVREQARYNAFIGLSWGIGAILGPVIGGAFSDSSATWRWAFYINLPLAGLFAPIFIFNFPQYPPFPDLSVRTKIMGLDWAGTILNASTFVLFMVALTLSGTTFAWGSSGAIALWVVFGVAFITYILQQVFCIFTTPERRIFPVHFLKRRTFLLLFFATASTASAAATCIYYIPLFFQFTKGDSAIEAAVRLLPLIFMFVFSVMFSGGLLPILPRYAIWYPPAGVLILVGGVLMFLVTSSTATSAIYGFEVLIAVGAGFTFQIPYAIVAAKCEPKDISAAIGFINVSQLGSIAIGLTMAGNIFQNVGFNKLQVALSGYGFSEAELRSTLAGAQSHILSQGSEKVQRLALNAIVATISDIYALVITSGAVILACSVFIRWEKLSLAPPASD